MVLKMFRDKVEQVEDPGVHAVLATLARLYAIHGIGDHTGDFLQVRLLSAPPDTGLPYLGANLSFHNESVGQAGQDVNSICGRGLVLFITASNQIKELK